MIKTFKDKALEKCWRSGKGVKIDAKLKRRLLNKLDYLDAATELEDLAFPPSNHLHPLKGSLKGYHAISINGPWRIIFQHTRSVSFLGIYRAGIFCHTTTLNCR